MNPEILFEDNDLLALNKPAGLMVHADGRQQKETLADWIIRERPEIVGIGEPMTIDGNVIDRPGIVHRLDEATSGVLLIAKTQEAFLFLKKQFQEHKIQKEYHAFVWGVFKEREGVVHVPIGRSPNDFRRRLAGRGARGTLREALTVWQVAGTLEEKGNHFSFMHLFPKTGRTHQLRVHLHYLQHPIVSDELYAPTKPHALGFDRLALHARTITFLLRSGEEKTLSAPYSKDFEAALAGVTFL
ncbi:MAG TPA: RluA family pseudouridine synthase [Candidatus Paceibacterota bacterium]|nr:RluA family pseudouridine synthase [Candidatus Paceibacterota bacterium]